MIAVVVMVKNKELLTILGVAAVVGLFGVVLSTNPGLVGGKTCGDKIIDQHNQAIRSTENFADNVKKVAKSVEGKAGYKNDITCVYIVFQHYSYAQDVTKSRELFDTMKTLQQKGKRIDAKVLDQQSFEQMEMYVKSLEHNRDIGDKSDGSG